MLELERGTTLTFELRMPGLVIDDPIGSLVWRGVAAPVQFGVTVPTDHPLGAVIGTVTVSLGSVPIGHVKFKLAVTEAAQAEPEPVGDAARHYYTAFISYAAQDRAEVAKRVQMLPAVGIHYFQDVLNLTPGERWQQALYRRIDESDLFLLFWSSAAKGSDWVEREWRYALERKGDDDLAPPEIRPVPIEGPPPVAPPPELAHLHFGDPLLYLKV